MSAVLFEPVIGIGTRSFEAFLSNINASSDVYISTYSIVNTLTGDTWRKILTTVGRKTVHVFFSGFLFNENEEKRNSRMEFFRNLQNQAPNLKAYSVRNLHAKVYLQNHICYVGSENFTQKPKNIEAGFIVRDTASIKLIQDQLFGKLLQRGIPVHWTKDYMFELLDKALLELKPMLGRQVPSGGWVVLGAYDEDDINRLEQVTAFLDVFLACATFLKYNVSEIEHFLSELTLFLEDAEWPADESGKVYIDHQVDKDAYDDIYNMVQEAVDMLEKFINQNK